MGHPGSLPHDGRRALVVLPRRASAWWGLTLRGLARSNRGVAVGSSAGALRLCGAAARRLFERRSIRRKLEHDEGDPVRTRLLRGRGLRRCACAQLDDEVDRSAPGLQVRSRNGRRKRSGLERPAVVADRNARPLEPIDQSPRRRDRRHARHRRDREKQPRASLGHLKAGPCDDDAPVPRSPTGPSAEHGELARAWRHTSVLPPSALTLGPRRDGRSASRRAMVGDRHGRLVHRRRLRCGRGLRGRAGRASVFGVFDAVPLRVSGRSRERPAREGPCEEARRSRPAGGR